MKDRIRILQCVKISEEYNPHFDSYSLRDDGTFCGVYRPCLGITKKEMNKLIKSKKFYVKKIEVDGEIFINQSEYVIKKEVAVKNVIIKK